MSPKPGDLRTLIDEIAIAHAAQAQRLASLFALSPVVMVKETRSRIYLLAKSTNKDRWRITEFGLDGPFGWEEYEDRGAAIDELAYRVSATSNAFPLTDEEWRVIQSTAQFQRGAQWRELNGMASTLIQIGHSPVVWFLANFARGLKDWEEGVALLRATMENFPEAQREWRKHWTRYG